MDVNQVRLVYFSPTGTTEKVLNSIAKGLAINDVQRFNLTLPAGAGQDIPAFGGELVIIGAPVYGGRVPAKAIERMKKIKANNTPAVLVVVYGNREFEDALLELKNLAMELGFKPVAGAAFIGEHSFASENAPIATGRPDSQDQQEAAAFGAKVKAKLDGLAGPEVALELPGRFPYESAPRAMTICPVSLEDTCILCGTCASVCPTGAVTVDDTVTTEVENCIRCSACVKSCPTGARVWQDEMMATITNWLRENCAARKQPQTFGV